MSQEPENELPTEELLVHGRAKRATAGNRMHFLMQHLEDEDVRNDLLQEDETDQIDYQLSDTEDVAFESSDDSDDEGPPRDGQDEDLQGEKELQKAERQEARKKKRKANDFTNMPLNPLMKRQRLAATNSLLAPRPRKKSERISWLPTLDDAPTRQSRRRQTVANKEQTEAKLKESQKRSEKAHELIKIAAEKKAASAVPALTQEDRMKRALKVEKENSRTLNRWEKAEEERQLAQQRRLEALRDRQLEGPVFRYWSGSVMWEGEKIKVKRVHQPRIEAVVETKPNPPAEKPATETLPQSTVTDADKTPTSNEPQEAKTAHEPGAQQTEDTAMVDATDEPTLVGILDQESKEASTTEKDEGMSPKATGEPTENTDSAVVETAEANTSNLSKETGIEQNSTENTAEQKPSEPDQASASASEQKSQSFLDGIHFWASQSPEATAQKNRNSVSQTPAPAPAAESQTAEAAPAQTQPSQPSTADQPPAATIDPAKPPTTLDPTLQSADPTQQPSTPFDVYPQIQPEATSLPPPIPLIREQAQRTLIILEAFPELEIAPPIAPSNKKSTTTTSLLSSILIPDALPTLTPQETKYLNSKSAKKKEFLPPPPPKPVCAITAKPAHYKDPKTGMPYQGLEAYKALQRVSAGGCRWGGQGWDCWMGILGEGVMGRVARGVPECFVTGKVVRKTEAKEKKEVKKEDGVGVGPMATVGVLAPVAAVAPAATMVAASPAPPAANASNKAS
ncbi:YL1-domain-containing protein [Aureobasidium sp. EXF-12298]|nr:YL1-domain-containing protein [Aureobasidium sp. EXF-12298]